VHAVTTTRAGGASRGAYESFNLGDHVGDDAVSVQRNRALLREALKLPSEPVWLKQVHGTNVVDGATTSAGTTADGAVTDGRVMVLAVLTADCLPIFLCGRDGTKVGLLHAGWRGLAAGIVEAGVRAMRMPHAELLAHLGPGIGPDAYEVGEDVRGVFLAHDAEAARAFKPNGNGRWLADMYELARLRLRALGVSEITGGEYCTYRERDKFYSYRRDGVTGRMASLLWRE
jgi:YfiH family protein